MALRDYVGWHDDYDRPGSNLWLRLLVVREQIDRALDDLPAGPVRVVSLCAGQGDDIIGVARRHRRGPDLSGRLVELDEHNAAAARVAIADAGLRGLEVAHGDAGVTDAYQGVVPAELVLACGVFGNIERADIDHTIAALPTLCAPGAWVIWTRHPHEPGVIDRIRERFAEAGFSEQGLVVDDTRSFGVGAGRLEGDPAPLEPHRRLFTFVI